MKIRLHNNGEPIRNWLHADDTARAVMKIIDGGEINQIYNVSGDFEQKNIDTVKKIIKAYFGTLHNWENYVDFSYSRQGQDVRYSLDDSKLRWMGWTPVKNFDYEIVRMVQYYKESFIW